MSTQVEENNIDLDIEDEATTPPPMDPTSEKPAPVAAIKKTENSKPNGKDATPHRRKRKSAIYNPKKIAHDRLRKKLLQEGDEKK